LQRAPQAQHVYATPYLAAEGARIGFPQLKEPEILIGIAP